MVDVFFMDISTAVAAILHLKWSAAIVMMGAATFAVLYYKSTQVRLLDARLSFS